MGPSAALTPAIWEKTIPYDGENFHLEYMDLEEFLMENGIAGVSDDVSQDSSEDEEAAKTPTKTKATPSARAVAKATKPASTAPVALLPIQELDKCEEELVTMSEADIIADITAGE